LESGEKMPVKTYTREVETLFSKDEMSALFKEAHSYCKNAVAPKPHRIGKRGRLVIYRPRSEYLNCIKNYIQKKVDERVKERTGGRA